MTKTEELANLRDTGLTIGQPKVLEYLAGHDGVSQIEIARASHIEAATQAFGWVITRAGIPQTLARSFTSSITNPLVFVFAVCVILLVAGCFIDAVPALLIFAPIFCPTADAYGINMIYFGVVMVIVLCIGLATPPVGINLYVASSVGGQPVHKITPPSAHSSAGHFRRYGDRDPGPRDHHAPSQRAVTRRANGSQIRVIAVVEE